MPTNPTFFHASHPAEWRATLCVSGPDEAQWVRPRAAQLAALRRAALPRLLLSLATIALLLIALGESVSMTIRLAWSSFAITAAAYAAAPHLTGHHGPPARQTSLLWREMRAALANALVWGAAPALLWTSGSSGALIGLWAVMAVYMAGSALLLTALPIAASSIALIAGLGLAGVIWTKGHALLCVVTLLFNSALVMGTLIHGRRFMRLHAADAALCETRDMVRLLLRESDETGGDWLWQTDLARCLVGVSPRFAEALGAPVELLEGKPLLQVLAGPGWESGNVAASLQELSDKLRQRDKFSGLMLPVEVRGETRWWALSAVPRLDEAGAFSGFFGVGSDVTEAHRSVDRISRMARFDTLTSLPNRANLMENLEQAINAASAKRGRCALLLIDLDRFKAVNDTLGHPVGDRLLVQVAERLRAIASPNETCGRLGGDEFAVIIRDAQDPAQVQAFAEKIVATLSQPYDVDRHRVVIGASIGSATSPRDGRTVDMLVRSADLALYQSKDHGGGGVCTYLPRFEAEAEDRRLTEIALHSALEGEEFGLVYQPVIDVAEGRIVEFEASLRWTSPTRGPVPPERFLPIARDTRLIIPIGNWALHKACQDASGWPGATGITIAISAEQLSDAGFVTATMQALSQSRLPPHRLTIEVGEDILQGAGPAGRAVLDDLDALGVRLSLGNFGTGASALGHLSQSRFTSVRIHKDLIRQAARGERESAARLRAIVTLADNLAINPTVRGVDSDAQLRMARTLGCRQVQGGLFGGPLAVDAVQTQMAASPFPRAVA